MKSQCEKKISEKVFNFINEKKWDEVIDFFDDDASLIFPGTSPLGGVHRGKEAIKKYFRRMNIAVFDIRFDIKNISESEEIAFIEWENHGRTRRGKEYNNNGVTVIKIKNGKISELRDYLDTEKILAGGD